MSPTVAERIANRPLARFQGSMLPSFSTDRARSPTATPRRTRPPASLMNSAPPRPSILDMTQSMPAISPSKTESAPRPMVSLSGSTRDKPQTASARTPTASAIERSALALTAPVSAFRWSRTASMTLPNFSTASFIDFRFFLTFLAIPASRWTRTKSPAPMPAPSVRLVPASSWLYCSPPVSTPCLTWAVLNFLYSRVASSHACRTRRENSSAARATVSNHFLSVSKPAIPPAAVTAPIFPSSALVASAASLARGTKYAFSSSSLACVSLTNSPRPRHASVPNFAMACPA